jgi:hypothetical protein
MGKRKRSSRIGPYVPVLKAIMRTPAWRAMSPEARLLWIELRGWLKNDWSNNGRMFRSCRDAAEAIGMNKDTVYRKYVELEHFGFLCRTSEGFLGIDGFGHATHFRFTDLPYGTHPPTRDFEKWDGSPFIYRPRRPARKKQKPVLSRRTPRPIRSDIRRPPDRDAVCIVPSDIGGHPRCIVPSDITSFPLPKAREREVQGSLTARAPAQAGGAGSSPAPVSNVIPFADERGRSDGLMGYVASVIEQQLDELEARAEQLRRKAGRISKIPELMRE